MARKSTTAKRKSAAPKAKGRQSTGGQKKSTGGQRKSTSRKSMQRKSQTGSQRKSIKSKASSRSGGSKKDKALDVPFEPTTLNISNIHPFFLLLRSHERSILLKALKNIHHYLKYHFNEVNLMYAKTYMNDVKELSQTNENFIPEAAFKLLALITKDEASHQFVNTDESYMRFLFAQYLSKSDFIAKQASMILANVTKNVDVVRRMVEDGSGFDLKSLILNLSHADPDVCHNTMMIIGNVFQDLKCAEKLVNLKEFSYGPLFNLVDNDLIELQKKALTLIEWLGWHRKTTELKDRFIDQEGFDRMFSVLKKFHWRDIHPQVLKVLRVYFETDEERIRTMRTEGVGRFVWYIDFCEDDDLIAKALGNILDIATTVFGKLELVDLGFVPKVTAILSDGTVEMKLEACNIINEMLKNVETVRLFTELSPVPELVEIVTDPDHSWELKGAALGVLHNLCKFSADLAYLFTKFPLRDSFKQWIMKNILQMSLKFKEVLYDLMSVLVQHNIVRPQILDFAFVWAFLLGLRNTEPKMTHIQLVSAEALFYIIPQEHFSRQYIVAADGMQIITRALTLTKDKQLIGMLCNVVRVAAENDPNMLVGFAKLHVLDWLIKRKHMWTEIESMEWAASAIQNQFLPLKFEYRGRLTFNDITKNGFYIRRQYDDPNNLPIPPEATDQEGNHPYTVYISNFSLERDLAPDKITEDYAEKLKRDAALDEKCVLTYSLDFEVKEEQGRCYDISDEPLYIRKCAENCIKLQDDERLISLYEEVLLKLKQADEKYGQREYSRPFDHSWVLSRVEVLTDVVINAMKGKRGEPCNDHTIDLYVEELKLEENSRVIRLGRMEKGDSLERALLFKVLADKIDLPCSFWRGAFGNGWNEIALLTLGTEFPTRNKEEQKVKTEDKPEMPTRLIYPTHVVDLMVQPRRLMEVGSPEAEHYTGRPIKSVLYKVPESEPPPINTCVIMKSKEEE